MKLSVKVDSRDFDKAYADYVAFSKKSLEEIANKTAFEIAKIATTTTKTTSKEQIAAELHSNMKMAGVIVNRERSKKGLKGLWGAKMTKGIEALIKKRQRTIKFVASGWKAAIKAMAPFVKNKNGSPMPTGKAKSSLGGAQGARNIAGKASASIWNNVLGGKGDGSKPNRVTAIETEGLNKAIQIKKADMLVYINRKLKEAADKFNRR